MLNKKDNRVQAGCSGAIAMVALLLVAGAAQGQVCTMNESQQLLSPTPVPPSSYEFGSALAAQSDRALCTAGISLFTSLPGTVYGLRRTSGQWSIAQTITSPDASNGDQFGSSLAISGDWGIVGAPQEDPGAVLNCGAAYLYTWDGAAWTYHSRITPVDLVANKQFGRVVDIDGVIAVASAMGDNQGGTSAGAAYVFRYNGTAWVQEQKLVEQAPAASRRFGAAVAAEGDNVLVSAVPLTGAGNTEGVYVFRHNGTNWQEMQRVQSPMWPNKEGFGTALRIDGDTFATNAAPSGQPGLVRLFTFNGVEWTHQQTVSGPPTPLDGQFGRAFDLQDDHLIVGAPTRDAPTYPNEVPSFNAGLGFMFERTAGNWSLRWSVRSHPRFNQDTLFFNNSNDNLGMAAAFASDQYLLGATTPNSTSVPEFGYVAFFPVQPPDCDDDGAPDGCETDCDNDNAGDICQIMRNPISDCDLNGQLDVCQQPAEYVADNGQVSAIYGAFDQPLDMIWLNQFRVVAGGQRLTHVALPWTLYTTPGLPLTILVYDDPNNDGDPADALLVNTAPAITPDPVGGLVSPFTIVAVPTTFVGDIGDSFFIGAAMNLPLDNGGALDCTLTNSPARSWRGVSAPGQINITTPSANVNFEASTRRLMVRAYGLDCNGNGVNDHCDITDGFSLDLNSNGVPDECDDHCPADVSGNDNVVDVNDLLAVITTWGLCANCPPTHCPGDITPVGPPQGNCAIDVNDLLAVITSWGNCP